MNGATEPHAWGWIDSIANSWPGPVAHEYFRLRELIEEDEVIGAVWQLKDVAEVLIKLPAVVMARDVIEFGTSDALRNDVRRALLAKPPSLGDWYTLAATTLARPVLTGEAGDSLLLPDVATLFRQPGKKPRQTALAAFLREMINWRNEELGHGAFRLNTDEFRDDLQQHIGRLNELLENDDVRQVWNDAVFSIGPNGDGVLHGHQSIRERHQRQIPDDHQSVLESLLVSRGERTLDLSPYLVVRRCTVCRQQDVFLFNSVKRDRSNRYYFLDYLNGHQISRPGHQEADLEQELHRLLTDPATGDLPPDNPLAGDFLQETTARLLEETAFEADYIDPAYLRREFTEFLESREKGIFWLTGAAHSGKSVFTRGLSSIEPPLASRGQKETPLPPDVAVVTWHIKREYNCFPPQLRAFLDSALPHARVLNIRTGRENLPSLETDARDPAAAFTRLLRKLGQISEALGEERRVVICLDGLDELRPPEGRSVADYIPRAEQLPEGFYLLLTSRPLENCPPEVQRLESRLTDDAELQRFSIDVDDPGSPYRDLLRQYFDARLHERFRVLAAQELADALAGEPVPARSPEDTVEVPAALRRMLKVVWQDLQEERDPGGAGQPLPAGVAEEVASRIDGLFEQVLDRSEGLFLYVSHLVRLLADRTLELEDVGELPPGEGLLKHYVDRLETLLGGKQNDLLRRVILVLAAAEEAHQLDFNWQPPGYATADWPGLPLDVLGGLLDDLWIDGPGLSARLVFVLYSLKEVLRTWKGDASGHARYRLGLKEFTSTVRRLWPEELAAVHRRLAEQFHLEWTGRYEEVDADDPVDSYLLRNVLAHAESSGDAELCTSLRGDFSLLQSGIQRMFVACNKAADFAGAVQWGTLGGRMVLLGRTLKQLADTDRNNLAGSYMNRGVALKSGGDLTAAIEDYNRAIHLRTVLRKLRLLKGSVESRNRWPPEWQNSLAGAYMNRANVIYETGDIAAAIADYGRAIAAMEEIQERLEPDGRWPNEWKNDLARTCMNRGVALDELNKLEAALADYDRAIALMEGLREELEPANEWSLDWRNSLASAYTNRGVTRRKAGDSDLAIEDYGRAIELRETIRAILEPQGQWPPAWKNNLASAYVNRGVAQKSENVEEAIADFGRAIDLRENLRAELESQHHWPPAWQNDLAGAYLNRGNSWRMAGQPQEAIDDFTQAIKLREMLRDQLEPEGQWPPGWQHTLAGAYANRGIVHSKFLDYRKAAEDFRRALVLREALRSALEPRGQWLETWQDALATNYIMLSRAMERMGRAEDARQLRERAESLGGGRRAQAEDDD